MPRDYEAPTAICANCTQMTKSDGPPMNPHMFRCRLTQLQPGTDPITGDAGWISEIPGGCLVDTQWGACMQRNDGHCRDFRATP